MSVEDNEVDEEEFDDPEATDDFWGEEDGDEGD